uniref:Piscidin 4 n=1 Tax=Channa striata TaxID=64152 RepID=A0A376A904_CHASR|nr:Piscidin 4 [Channa striata]
MKLVMVFLVLSLVVLMAEPGECFFGRLRAVWKGAKAGFRAFRQGYREHRLARQRQRYGNEENPPENYVQK